MTARPVVRCALYTRKSSEEGLDQAFNSLHAQREACEAYVRSQASEGWKVLPDVYDDGGFSGGNIERPALKRLLEDIDAGKVDTIVVYKIDRLTRSLPDFARIVDRLDKAQASFVSVTQSFNTTTSMGRLTLNVLLSFAQFEREVTGERIRDKIAASKAKGMWMGGMPPLGYDPPTDRATRSLVRNEPEAEQVRTIFNLYLELGSVSALEARLAQEGMRSKVWVSAKGSTSGGVPLSRGALFHMLRNRVYLGEIVHGATSVAGCHPPIVEPDVFARVQTQLAANTRARKERPLRSAQLPLKGLVFDADGHPMSPSFGYGRGGRVYRYYVSAPLQQGRKVEEREGVLRRVSAEALEEAVRTQLATVSPGGDERSFAALLKPVRRVEVLPEALRIAFHAKALPRDVRDRLYPCDTHADQVVLVAPVRCQARGGRTWVLTPVCGSAVRKARRDPVLIRGLRQAHKIAAGLGWRASDGAFVGSGKAPTSSYERRLWPLVFLAPDIQQSILEGRQPPALTLDQLLKMRLPTGWPDQRHALGFDGK
ncbi:recombinase family protein [Brevundimonas sp. UBA7664]|uniref:recombinase family protein n=1 Tax=Brevundimonas sp. UBA7664 TaxID=1946141 RepID=UPI0025C2DC05|nr:recombinase family protein [Brevundimonas sp. UBA7664]